MKTITRHITLLACLLIGQAFGQGFERYGMSDGLPSEHVYRITQDSLGYIWAITDKGVARFDGRNFKVFTTRDGLPKNDIWDIRLGKDDKKWYFTKSGVLGYIQNDTVVNYAACNPETVLYPASIFQQGDDFAIGNNQMAYVIQDSCWQAVPNAQEIDYPMARLYHFKSELFGHLDPTVYKGIRYQSIDSLAMAMHHGGYIISNLNSKQQLEASFPSGLPLTEPRFNRFHWLNGGLQISGKNFVMPLGQDLEQQPPVFIDPAWNSHFAMLDRSGNLWCATFDKGILMLPAARRYNQQLLEGQAVRRLKKTNQGVVAMVRDSGYYRLQGAGGNFRPWVRTDALLFDAVQDPYSTANYLLTDQWVRKVDPQGETLLETSNQGLGLRSLVWFHDLLLAYNPGGLQQLDPASLEVMHIIPQFGIRALQVVDDELYVGTSGGLKRLRGESLQNLPMEEHLLHKPVLSMQLAEDGSLLVGTDGFGAYLLDPTGKQVEALSGAEFSSVNRIHQQGNDLLMATEAGLLHFTQEGAKWRLGQRYGPGQGLPSRAVNDGLMYGDQILAASDLGVTIANGGEQSSTGPVAIDLRRLSMDGKPLQVGASIKYSPNNQLNAGITLLDYTPGKAEQQFQYRLLPLQAEWLSGSGSNITFSDLKPGNYILEVENQGLKAQTTWVISPLWWQSWWGRSMLISLGLLAIVGVLYLIRRYELKRKLAKLEMQNKLTEFELYALRSQMNPHFVFNSLAAIQHCITKQDLKTAEKYLVKFSKLVRQFFELSKEESVAVSREAELLKSYLEIEQLRFGDRLSYWVEVDPALRNGKANIPTMLLQPVVENAVNHGLFNKEEGGTVEVLFKPTTGGMEVSITDDGVGYAQTYNNKQGGRRSTQVLEDRIFFLNKSGKWLVEKHNEPAHPDRRDQGSVTTFSIKPIV